jgi:hypothetical protein
MSSRNIPSSKLSIAILAILSLALVLVQAGVLQAQGFSDSSLRGTYSITFVGETATTRTMGGAMAEFDGEGGVTGTAFFNSPNSQPPPARVTLQVQISGTYTVNQDGMGTGSLTMFLGETPIGSFDFHLLITVMGTRGPLLGVAAEFFAFEDQPGALTGTQSVVTGKRLYY